MSVHQTKTGLWFCKWYIKGRPRKKYFGHGEEGRAGALAHDCAIKAEKEERRLRDEASGTVEDLCRNYHELHQCAHVTRVNNHYKFTRSILPSIGHVTAELLNSRHINEFVRERLATVKWSTVRRELSLLKAVYSWAASQNPPLITRNPMRDYRFRGPDDRNVPMPPTEREVERIRSCAEPHLARAIAVLWHTGIRPGGEVERLRWSDVDLIGRKLRVVGARKGGLAVRYVPISETLLAMMEAWYEDDSRMVQRVSELPLIHYGRKPVASLKTAWRNAKKRAKITRRMRLYDLRHKFATELLEHGIAPGVVSRLVGHSREDTTQRHYLHVTQDTMRKAVEMMPDLMVLDGTNVDEKSKAKP